MCCSGTLASIVNALMIVVFVRNPQLRSVSNALLVNLCCLDSVGAIYFITSPIENYVLANQSAFVKFRYFLFYIWLYGELMSLLVIGIERYIHILHHIKHSTLVTMPHTIKFLAIFWSGLLLIGGLSIWLEGDMRIDNPADYFTSNVFQKRLVMAWLIMIALVSFYIILFKKAKNKLLSANPNSSMVVQFRVYKVAAIVLGMYIITVLPNLIFATLMQLAVISPTTYIRYCRDINLTFLSIQAWVNPFIYAWRDKKLNQAFRKVFGLPSPSIAPAINMAPVTPQICINEGNALSAQHTNTKC